MKLSTELSQKQQENALRRKWIMLRFSDEDRRSGRHSFTTGIILPLTNLDGEPFFYREFGRVTGEGYLFEQGQGPIKFARERVADLGDVHFWDQ